MDDVTATATESAAAFDGGGYEGGTFDGVGEEGGGFEYEYAPAGEGEYSDFADNAGGLDPFDPGFGEQLGATISEAVQSSMGEALAPYIGHEVEEYGFDGYEAAPEPISEEQAQQADAAIDQAFNRAEQGFGASFDRQIAFERAGSAFNELVAAGHDPQDAIGPALDYGARSAIEFAQGLTASEALVDAELQRVGDVDRNQVAEIASEVAQQLVASGWDGEEAVKTAVHEAATMVAGGTSYGGRRASTQDLLRVAHARNQADRAVDRIGAVQATPLVQATPGTRLSTEDLVAKWGRV